MSDELKKILEGLKSDYLKNMPAKLALIEKLWANGEIDLLETEFHKLKGTGKTYGLPEISDVGFLAEYLCAAIPDARDKGVKLTLSLLRQITLTRNAGAEFNVNASSEYSELRALYDDYAPKD